MAALATSEGRWRVEARKTKAVHGMAWHGGVRQTGDLPRHPYNMVCYRTVRLEALGSAAVVAGNRTK